MGEFAVTRSVERVELDATAVLGEAWQLYKRLFARSVVLGAIVFGLLGLLELLGRSGRAGAGLGLLSFAFTSPGSRYSKAVWSRSSVAYTWMETTRPRPPS